MNTSLRMPERFDYQCSHKQLATFSSLLTGKDQLKSIVLDMRDVLYIDSSALGAMILMKKKAKDCSVELSLENISPNAQQVLETASFDQLFR